MDLQDLHDDRRSDLQYAEITDQAQIINYLKATIEVGPLINFGNAKLE